MTKHRYQRQDIDLDGEMVDAIVALVPDATSIIIDGDEFTLVDAEGHELSIDDTIVQKTIADHVPPPKPISRLEVLADALEGPGTAADKMAAIAAWARSELAAQAQAHANRPRPERPANANSRGVHQQPIFRPRNEPRVMAVSRRQSLNADSRRVDER